MRSPFPTLVLCPVLIGRDAERQTLAHALAAARAGPPRAALISGEAGLGKSRLAAEIVSLAHSQGFTILSSSCFEPDRHRPYAPFLDLLRAFAHTQPAALALHQFLPGPAALGLSPAPASPPEPEKEKRWLAEALTDHLLSRTENGPTAPFLLVVEDLHWSDEASLELLLHFTRRAAGRPGLILLTFRSDEMGPELRHCLVELERACRSIEVALRRLDLAETEAMIGAIFEQRQPVRAEFVEAIHTLTDGNPFFVEEVLKALVTAGDIFFDAGLGWTRRPLGEVQVPRSIQDAVSRRTGKLSQPARRLLELAAVAGRRFDFALLQAVTGAGEPALIEQVKELTAAQLVIEETAETFAFRHALTQQAVYSGLLARERRALHRAIAEALAPNAAVVDLARHCFEAGLWEQALIYGRQAGEQAQAVYAPRAAAEHYTRAITAAGHLSAGVPPALHRARGQMRQTLGDFEAARADFQAMLDEARARQDRPAEWQALLELGFLWAARDYTRTGDYFDRALALAQALDDSASVAHSLNRMGNWHANVEQPEEARRCHQEARRRFEALGDRAGLAATLDLLGIASYIAGDMPQGVAFFEAAILLFQELGDRGGELSSRMMLSTRGADYLGRTVAPVPSRMADRLHDGEAALHLAREIEAQPGEALGQVWVGLNCAVAGEYGRALDLVQAGLAQAEALGHQHFMATAELVLGALHADLLAWPGACVHLERALELGQATNSLVWTRVAAGFLASVRLRLEQLEAAAALLQGFEPDLPMQAVGQRQIWHARAELALAQGEAQRALVIIDQLVVTAPNAGSADVAAMPWLALLRAEALLALGRAKEAERLLAAAQATAQACEMPPVSWRLEAAHGRARLALGRRDLAAEAFAGARASMAALARTLADAALRETFQRGALALIGRVNVDSPRRRAKQAAGGLTRREREVAGLIVQGKSNREIAAALVLSPRTVEVHIANIMSKLGLDSRAQVAVWAAERGLHKI